MDATASPQPLEGVRVVEVGGTVAVAGATKTLADYGADVVKIEEAGGGEIRRLPPFPDDRPNINHGAFHLGLDTGKRSIVVDTTTASGTCVANVHAGSGLLANVRSKSVGIVGRSALS